MKTAIIFLFSVFFLQGICHAQFPEQLIKIESQANASVSVSGNLSQGDLMDDLSWASKSTTACWPATQNTKFNGNHVLYYTTLPKHAKMWIEIIPDDENVNMSLYAYSIGTTNYTVPPSLSSCVSCEADHKWDYPKAGKTQDHSRTVYLNAINNPYNVVIGVVGAQGLSEGGYTIKITIEGGEEAEEVKQEELVVYNAASEKGKVLSYKGDLADGVQIHDLSWAWNSAVACFPETQKTKFNGNHVIYSTELPKYSIMEVKLIPDNKDANMSLYVYLIGANNNAIVPNLSSCVSCEVDHKWDYPKVGKLQDHTRIISNITAINNPYKAIIGVVGADGLKSGAYTIQIKLDAR